MDTGEDASERAKDAARSTRDSPALRRTARIGFAVLGVLHILIGAIAVSVAVGGDARTADQGGAMQQLRQNAIGGLVLLIVALALAALAVWRIADAFLTSGPGGTTRWGRRIKNLGVAAAYLVLAGTAIVYAVGGRTDASQSSQTLSSRILSAPGGGILLTVIGLAVAAIGGGFIVGAITRSFTKELRVPRGTRKAAIEVFGVVGYLGKGVAVVVTGLLFVIASITRDPHKAAGLDAALRDITALPFGPVLLCAVAAGLVAYGVFCIARAWYERM
ncbi:DUF1206 domain-containing protein [Microbacterium sp. 13-71-7]|uniref:DUF1206 domain-containing protein n=1 Tax=Microbacterium sp. 13-71-7 TaxID=1970399 RepID=UPI000BD9C19D|nr:DUF1206 domain-containing protein [Microbacterium sp. 13-71-7]OZB84144.1 MAG: hypothetical protein B7X32_08070 [Microbacterium sp. 13-71-7]